MTVSATSQYRWLLPWLVPLFSYLVVGVIDQVFWLPWVERVARALPPDDPLFDWGHVHLPDFNHLSYIGDFLPLFPLLYSLFFVGVHKTLPCFTLLAIGVLIRMFSYGMTILPTVVPRCREAWHSQHLGPLELDFVGGCFDLVFSGHTLWVWMFVHHAAWRSKHRLPSILILYSYGIAAAVFVAASKMHYSVDVFLSVVISGLLCFGFYDKVGFIDEYAMKSKHM
eukprot:GILJ01005175.1.p1 GENE.GILJ01005175.1~~GILJ01005175.1.p1  ORF type:complete len:237 (+),score=13.44 GILJ01005175.1:37-711(+)